MFYIFACVYYEAKMLFELSWAHLIDKFYYGTAGIIIVWMLTMLREAVVVFNLPIYGSESDAAGCVICICYCCHEKWWSILELCMTGFPLNYKSCSTTVTVASGLFKLVPFYVLLLIFDLIIYWISGIELNMFVFIIVIDNIVVSILFCHCY